MVYQNEAEIKTRMKKAGLNTRDLANECGVPPGTMGNWLGGWAPLSREHRTKILSFILSNEEEIEKSEIRRGN